MTKTAGERIAQTRSETGRGGTNSAHCTCADQPATPGQPGPSSHALDQAWQRVAELQDREQALQQQIACLEDRFDTVQQQLHLAQARLQRLTEPDAWLDLLPGAAVLTSLDGTILRANWQAAILHGYAHPADLLGSHLLDLAAPEAHQMLRDNIEHLVKTGTLKDDDYTLLRQDGSRFLAEIHAAPEPQADGPPRALLALLYDITARKQSEALMIEAMRLATGKKLTEIIAHEINTPLQAVLYSLALVSDSNAEDRAHFLWLAQQDVARIGQLIHQLKTFYEPGHTAHGLVHLNSLIEQALIISGARLVEHLVPIERSLASNLPPVSGCAGQLQHVLLSLLLHALESMPHGGRLRLSTWLGTRKTSGPDKPPTPTSPAPPYVVLEVADTGKGIDPAIQDYLFEPFLATGDHVAYRGLLASQQIIGTYGGKMTFSSDPGKGTTFRILLPPGCAGGAP